MDHPSRARPARLAAGVAALALVASTLDLVASSLAAGVPASLRRPVPAASAATCRPKQTLLSWPLDRLAAETVVVPADGSAIAAVGPEVAEGAGGIVVFGSTVPPGFAAGLKAVEVGPVAPFVMADEEGGAAQRLENVVGPLPAARTMGATLAPAGITALGARVGARLRSAGVTMDLAPVLDVDGGAGPNDADADGTRSFSAVPSIAARDGVAFAKGLGEAGVVAVAKHFPGLGGATANTDVRPAATVPLTALERGGLVPFEAAIAAHIPAVMVSNATVPGLSGVPADLSSIVVTGLLRDELGFRGLVLTDSLSAPSITDVGFTVPTAAVAALRAGADMVLYNLGAASFSAIVGAISAAVGAGRLSKVRLVDAVFDIVTAKGLDVCALGTTGRGV